MRVLCRNDAVIHFSVGFSDAKCACASEAADPQATTFLGDPAVNIDMSSFDEFVSDHIGDIQSKVFAKTVSEPQVETIGTAVKPKSMRNLSLSLNDRSNINMSVSQASGEVFGTGTVTLGNKTERFGAFGKEDGAKLDMNLIVLDSDLYRLELVEKGGSVSENYDRLTSGGKSLSGTAAGWWIK